MREPWVGGVVIEIGPGLTELYYISFEMDKRENTHLLSKY